MQRAPALLSLLLFAALCASLAYWLLQWFAPAPRAVAAPPEAGRTMPPVAAASALFGGRAQDSGGAQVQLRGILQAGKASIAIIAAEGKPVRALGVDAEVLPGLTVKEIGPRTVVLTGRGAERELTLPAFAAQEGSTTVQPVGAPAEPPPPQQPQPSQAPQPQPSAAPPSSAGGSEGGSSAAGAEGRAGVAPVAPASRPAAAPPQPSAPAVPQLPRPPLR